MLDHEFFDRARDFRHAYDTLPNSGRHPEWAKYLLFYHAMELALKAYLIRHGVSEKDLRKRKKFGHDIKKLVDGAVERGLILPHGSQEMIAGLGGQPPDMALSNVPADERIRYPGGGPAVYSLGQFQPYLQHVFSAVEIALGLRPPSV